MEGKHKYVAKPVEIQAIQWDGTAKIATRIVEWVAFFGGNATYECIDPDRCTESHGDSPHAILIDTLEGTMRTLINDYVIKETVDEFYPCKPNVFEAKYDRKATADVHDG